MYYNTKTTIATVTRLMLGICLLVSTHLAFAGYSTVAIVKLYSDGQQVAQWNALDTGYNDGGCFVFHVKKSVHSREVKICGGVFTVESVK